VRQEIALHTDRDVLVYGWLVIAAVILFFVVFW
jgi:hypothetical protein